MMAQIQPDHLKNRGSGPAPTGNAHWPDWFKIASYGPEWYNLINECLMLTMSIKFLYQ